MADVNLKLVGKRWLIGVKSSFGQVAEWLKAAARKSCYATQVASEVRILPLSAKSLGKRNQFVIADRWQGYGN